MRIVKCRAFCIDFTCKVLRGELGAIGSWFVQGVDYMHYENKIKSIYGLKGIGAFVVAFLWHYQHYKPTSSPFFELFTVSYCYGHYIPEC